MSKDTKIVALSLIALWLLPNILVTIVAHRLNRHIDSHRRPAPRPVAVAEQARVEIPPELPVVIRNDTTYVVTRMWFVPHGKTMMIECELEVKKEAK